MERVRVWLAPVGNYFGEKNCGIINEKKGVSSSSILAVGVAMLVDH